VYALQDAYLVGLSTSALLDEFVARTGEISDGKKSPAASSSAALARDGSSAVSEPVAEIFEFSSAVSTGDQATKICKVFLIAHFSLLITGNSR